jgi:hypothetical protein
MTPDLCAAPAGEKGLMFALVTVTKVTCFGVSGIPESR